MNSYLSQPSLTGTLELEFTIEPAGNVSHVEAKPSTPAAKEMCDCIVHALGSMQMSMPQGPSDPPLRLHYRIHFAPPPPDKWRPAYQYFPAGPGIDALRK